MAVEYSTTALKALRKMDQKTAAKLMDKIDAYAADPAGEHLWARPLAGVDGLRIRQGDYRAICRVEDGETTVLAVVKVGHRKDVYR